MRKRLLPFLLFDKASSKQTEESVESHLSSVFGKGDAELPVFPEMSGVDKKRLLKYLWTNDISVASSTDSKSDEEGISKTDGGVVDDDHMNSWNKLRIFQSLSAANDADVKAEEKMVGKILNVDQKCKGDTPCHISQYGCVLKIVFSSLQIAKIKFDLDLAW